MHSGAMTSVAGFKPSMHNSSRAASLSLSPTDAFPFTRVCKRLLLFQCRTPRSHLELQHAYPTTNQGRSARIGPRDER